MRVSTANTYEIGVQALQRRQRELSDTQTQLTTGKRVNRASDDPVAAARAERALAGAARAETSQRSVEASRTVMLQTESALGDAGELMQQARELLVAAGNATYGAAERKGIADQLARIRDQLLAVSNRSDGAGTFLFGGQGSSDPPFVDARPQVGIAPERGGVRYVGSAGNLQTDASTNLPLALDGAAIWTSARTGNGVFEIRPQSAAPGAWVDGGRVVDPSQLTGARYSVAFDAASTTLRITNLDTGTALAPEPYVPGRAIEREGMAFIVDGAPADGETWLIEPSVQQLNAFGILDKAVADLSSGRAGAALNQAVGDGLRNVDAVLGNLLAARAHAGGALARIDDASARLADQKLHHQSERSAAEDLDMIEAISEFETRQTGYDAALKSYSMVQRMSLFQYINV